MTEIDDEMVDRAIEAFSRLRDANTTKEAMRNALAAGLYTKPEPEIEVTEGMMRAGYEAAGGFYAISEGTVENIYRAMESTRLKEAENNRFQASLDKAIAEQAGLVCAAYAAKPTSHHRRKDDPK